MEKKEIELWYTEEEKLYAYIYEYSDYKILEFKFINSNFSGKGTIYLDEYYKEYQNYINRVNDIISELESQVEPLREQKKVKKNWLIFMKNVEV